MSSKFRNERDAIHIWESSMYRVIKTREEQIEIPKEEQDMEPSTRCWDSTVFGPQTPALFSLHTDAHSSDSSQPSPTATTTTPTAKPSAFQLNQLAQDLTNQDRKPLWRLLAVLLWEWLALWLCPQSKPKKS